MVQPQGNEEAVEESIDCCTRGTHFQDHTVEGIQAVPENRPDIAKQQGIHQNKHGGEDGDQSPA